MKASRLQRLLRHKGRPAMPRKRVAGTVQGLLKHADSLVVTIEDLRREAVHRKSLVRDSSSSSFLHMHDLGIAERAERRMEEAVRERDRCLELAFQLEHCIEHEDCRQNRDLARACMTAQRESSRTPI